MSSLRSPAFVQVIQTGQLAAGTSYYHNYQTDDNIGGFVPLNNLIVQNFSGQRLSLSYGDRQNIILRPNSNFTDPQAYGIRSIEVKNLDAANANDDLIQIIVQRTVTGDDALIAAALGLPLAQVSRGDW